MIIYKAYHDEYREYGSGERHIGYSSTKEKALKYLGFTLDDYVDSVSEAHDLGKFIKKNCYFT